MIEDPVDPRGCRSMFEILNIVDLSDKLVIANIVSILNITILIDLVHIIDISNKTLLANMVDIVEFRHIFDIACILRIANIN